MIPLPPPPASLPSEVRLTVTPAAAGGGAPLAAIQAAAAAPRAYLARGRQALAHGRWVEAANAYELLLKTHRRCVEAYVGEAWAYLPRNQYGTAYLALSEATRLRPGYQPAWRELGRSCYFLKRYERAADACSRAIALDPRDADAWLIKGLALGLAKKPSGAIPALDQAAARLPQDPTALVMKGRLLLESGQPGQAVAPLEEALKRHPGVAETQALLARAEQANGAYGSAAWWWLRWLWPAHG